MMSPKELQYIEDALGHEQFLLSQCKSGQIPCQRMGTGKRGLILIPAAFVQSQLEEALGKDNPMIQEIMYA